jgi:hypothetical protein
MPKTGCFVTSKKQTGINFKGSKKVSPVFLGQRQIAAHGLRRVEAVRFGPKKSISRTGCPAVVGEIISALEIVSPFYAPRQPITGVYGECICNRPARARITPPGRTVAN